MVIVAQSISQVASTIPSILENIQAQMLDNARRERDSNIAIAYVLYLS